MALHAHEELTESGLPVYKFGDATDLQNYNGNPNIVRFNVNSGVGLGERDGTVRVGVGRGALDREGRERGSGPAFYLSLFIQCGAILFFLSSAG